MAEGRKLIEAFCKLLNSNKTRGLTFDSVLEFAKYTCPCLEPFVLQIRRTQRLGQNQVNIVRYSCGAL